MEALDWKYHLLIPAALGKQQAHLTGSGGSAATLTDILSDLIGRRVRLDEVLAFEEVAG